VKKKTTWDWLNLWLWASSHSRSNSLRKNKIGKRVNTRARGMVKCEVSTRVDKVDEDTEVKKKKKKNGVFFFVLGMGQLSTRDHLQCRYSIHPNDFSYELSSSLFYELLQLGPSVSIYRCSTKSNSQLL